MDQKNENQKKYHKNQKNMHKNTQNNQKILKKD